MKHVYLFICLVVFTLTQWCSLGSTAVYAEDSDHGEIRGMSSKKSEQLFIQMAISLLNGKSRFVSLDNMVKILKDYKIVEFKSKDVEPAKEIILKEIAFRMLKQHYLPRIGDKIKVYKSQGDFLKDAGIPSIENDSLETAIRLPLEITTIKDRAKLKTIQWTDLVMQISTTIEKMWLERIRYTHQDWGNIVDEKVLLEAVVLLRKKFIQGEDIAVRLGGDQSSANRVFKVAEERIDSWLRKGLISKEDIPALAEMLIQYIIHSNSRNVSYITKELKGLRDTNLLKEALRQRIINTAENIKSYHPTDYGVFAMLQSLLNEVSLRFSLFSSTSTEQPANVDFKESRHSA